MCTLTLNLLTTTIVAPPSNASKWQMGFNSAFKGLNSRPFTRLELILPTHLPIRRYKPSVSETASLK